MVSVGQGERDKIKVTRPRSKARLIQSFPFPSLRVFDLEFSALHSCLCFRDLNSCVSSIFRPLPEPPRAITQMGAFLKKHGLSIVMSLVHRTHSGAEWFFRIQQAPQEI